MRTESGLLPTASHLNTTRAKLSRIAIQSESCGTRNGKAVAFVLACAARAGKGFGLGQDFIESRFEPGQDGRGGGEVA
jgi:hypothetical protein